MTWDGTERRKQREDGREGRRPSDQHCGEHYVLWTTHDKDKDEHRVLTCGKIAKLETNMDKEVTALETKIEKLSNIIVGKYWFRVVMGLFGIGIAFLYTQNREILANQHDFVKTVQTIEKTQVKTVETLSVFKKEIEALNTRQDVLRDAHMKLMENHQGENGGDGSNYKK